MITPKIKFLLEMAFRYDRRERLQNPDGYGKRTGESEDTVEMFLCFKNDRIQSVSFDTDGCINTNACANTVSHLSDGKTIEEAWEITPVDVIEFLETLPKENNEKKVIVFNFSGHGFFDLLAYKEFMSGKLEDYELPKEDIKKALDSPDMPKIDESQF